MNRHVSSKRWLATGFVEELFSDTNACKKDELLVSRNFYK